MIQRDPHKLGAHTSPPQVRGRVRLVRMAQAVSLSGEDTQRILTGGDRANKSWILFKISSMKGFICLLNEIKRKNKGKSCAHKLLKYEPL